MLHLLIVAAILGYFWLLFAKVAKPKLNTSSDGVKSSKGILWLQTIASWVLVLVFGIYGLSLMVMMPRHHAASGDTFGQITDLVFALLLPFLFALSVRWARSLMAQRTR